MAWLRIKSAAEYADVSPRTLRKWLKTGLKHARLPSGTVLIKRSWLDEYLEQFAEQTELSEIVDEIMDGLNR